MSVVVRMEMPKACWSCGLRFVCKAANDFLTTKEAGCSVLKVGMEGCLILCQLPEGHGRLVDADAMADDVRSLWDYKTVDGITASTVLKQIMTDIGNCPTIVPAERSET